MYIYTDTIKMSFKSFLVLVDLTTAHARGILINNVFSLSIIQVDLLYREWHTTMYIVKILMKTVSALEIGVLFRKTLIKKP